MSYPNLWQIMNICSSENSALSWLKGQGVFYDSDTGFGVMTCRNGEQMNLVSSGARGKTWQCPKKLLQSRQN
jgi:hypothetical protein